MDLYSEKMDKFSEAIAFFQSLCTFIDEEEANEVVSMVSNNETCREDLRARIASLRSDVQSIEESLGENDDNIDLHFDQKIPSFIGKGDKDNAPQMGSQSSRVQQGFQAREDAHPIESDIPNPPMSSNDGRITVVVNLYTK
jgi:hypothetical protein